MTSQSPRRRIPLRRPNASGNATHSVGYGNPPRAHRFRPGQSGNPRGRPKNTKNETTILRELLNRKIEVRDGGRPRKITVLEAILLRFTEDALKGNTKTATFLFNRYAASNSTEPQSEDISATDREIIDEFVERLKTQLREKS
jgi:hypothetical protein